MERTAIENIYFNQIVSHCQNNFCMKKDIENIYCNLKTAMSNCYELEVKANIQLIFYQ